MSETFRSHTKSFSHLNFSLSRKQRYEQTPLSFRCTFRFVQQPKSLQMFSTCFISYFKDHSKIIELKKHFSNTPLRVVKTVRIKVKLPHVKKKPLAKKEFLVQTPFSHSTLKLEQKHFTPQNHSLFDPLPAFRPNQNHYSNLTSKVMKICEQILKRTANRYHSNSFELLKRRAPKE